MLTVLLMRDDSQIGSAIIKTIAVDMIYNHAVRGLHNFAVELKPPHRPFMFARSPPGVRSSSLLNNAPLYAFQKVCIFGIDENLAVHRDYFDAIRFMVRVFAPASLALGMVTRVLTS